MINTCLLHYTRDILRTRGAMQVYPGDFCWTQSPTPLFGDYVEEVGVPWGQQLMRNWYEVWHYEHQLSL